MKEIKDKLKQIADLLIEVGDLVEAIPEPSQDEFTKNKFMRFYTGTDSAHNASMCFDNIESALKENGIYSKNTMIGAMSTIRTEVGRSFFPVAELASGDAYELRADLGNTKVGDGAKYKGRGYIQLTGKANYAYFGNKLGLDLVNNPDLALDPINSADILALYFKINNIHTVCDIGDWTRVRVLVNGGKNGLETFLRVVADYLG